MLAKNANDFFTNNVEGFMEEVEFERYCMEKHGYKYTGHEKSVGKPEKMSDADDGDIYCREKQFFTYEKGKNTVHVHNYEYSSYKVGSGHSILGYSVIDVQEKPSIWLK